MNLWRFFRSACGLSITTTPLIFIFFPSTCCELVLKQKPTYTGCWYRYIQIHITVYYMDKIPQTSFFSNILNYLHGRCSISCYLTNSKTSFCSNSMHLDKIGRFFVHWPRSEIFTTDSLKEFRQLLQKPETYFLCSLHVKIWFWTINPPESPIITTIHSILSAQSPCQ